MEVHIAHLGVLPFIYLVFGLHVVVTVKPSLMCASGHNLK